MYVCTNVHISTLAYHYLGNNKSARSHHLFKGLKYEEEASKYYRPKVLL